MAVRESADAIVLSPRVATMLPVPRITSALRVAFPDGKVRYCVTTTAANLPIKYGAVGLPPGLTLDQRSGIMLGTLPSGVFQFRLTVTNDAGRTEAVFTIVSRVTNVAKVAVGALVAGEARIEGHPRLLHLPVDPPAPPPVYPTTMMPRPVITSPATVFLVDEAVSYQITTTDANHPIRFGAEDLPAGLVVDPIGGRITGTLVHGLYHFTVTVENPVGRDALRLTVQVGDTNLHGVGGLVASAGSIAGTATRADTVSTTAYVSVESVGYPQYKLRVTGGTRPYTVEPFHDNVSQGARTAANANSYYTARFPVNGTHTLKFRVTDATARVCMSDTLSIVVNNPAPIPISVAIDGPTSMPAGSSALFPYVVGEGGIAPFHPMVWFDGVPTPWNDVNYQNDFWTWNATYPMGVTVTFATPGSHVVTVGILDSVGTISTFDFYVDVVDGSGNPPWPTMTGPTEVTAGEQVYYNVTLPDEGFAPFQRIEIRTLDGANSATLSTAGGLPMGSNHDIPITFTTPARDDEIYVVVYDWFGTSWDGDHLAVRINESMTPPGGTIEVSGFTDEYYGGLSAFNGTYVEDRKAYFYFDWYNYTAGWIEGGDWSVYRKTDDPSKIIYCNNGYTWSINYEYAIGPYDSFADSWSAPALPPSGQWYSYYVPSGYVDVTAY